MNYDCNNNCKDCAFGYFAYEDAQHISFLCLNKEVDGYIQVHSVQKEIKPQPRMKVWINTIKEYLSSWRK